MVFYSFKHLHIPVTIFNPSLDVKKKNKKKKKFCLQKQRHLLVLSFLIFQYSCKAARSVF